MDSSGILHINLTIEINLYFCYVFFLAIKWAQKGVHRNEGSFLLWDQYEVRQAAAFYTTQNQDP